MRQERHGADHRGSRTNPCWPAGTEFGYHDTDEPGHERFRIAAQLLGDGTDRRPVGEFERWFTRGEQCSASSHSRLAAASMVANAGG